MPSMSNSRLRRTKTSRKPPIEVRRSPIQGRGVFATRRIRKGARIVEYTGKHVPIEETDVDDEAKQHAHNVFFEIGDGLVIDPRRGGNEARFINHSCDPNCRSVEDNGRIFIEAIRNIQPGVELSYEYNLIREGPPGARWRELYACRCGARNCRGTMLARPKRKRAK
jgi:SET domain-containing protein